MHRELLVFHERDSRRIKAGDTFVSDRSTRKGLELYVTTPEFTELVWDGWLRVSGMAVGLAALMKDGDVWMESQFMPRQPDRKCWRHMTGRCSSWGQCQSAAGSLTDMHYHTLVDSQIWSEGSLDHPQTDKFARMHLSCSTNICAALKNNDDSERLLALLWFRMKSVVGLAVIYRRRKGGRVVAAATFAQPEWASEGWVDPLELEAGRYVVPMGEEPQAALPDFSVGSATLICPGLYTWHPSCGHSNSRNGGGGLSSPLLWLKFSVHQKYINPFKNAKKG